MARSRHPDKDIEAAVAYAEANGWVFVRQGSHGWGIFHCPGIMPIGSAERSTHASTRQGETQGKMSNDDPDRDSFQDL
jgi:hypothetical protein